MWAIESCAIQIQFGKHDLGRADQICIRGISTPKSLPLLLSLLYTATIALQQARDGGSGSGRGDVATVLLLMPLLPL